MCWLQLPKLVWPVTRTLALHRLQAAGPSCVRLQGLTLNSATEVDHLLGHGTSKKKKKKKNGLLCLFFLVTGRYLKRWQPVMLGILNSISCVGQSPQSGGPKSQVLKRKESDQNDGASSMTTGAKTSCGGRSSGGLHDRGWDSMDDVLFWWVRCSVGGSCHLRVSLFLYFYEHLSSSSSRDEPKALHNGPEVPCSVILCLRALRPTAL